MEAVIHICKHCKHLTILTFAWLLTSLLKGRISSALIVIVWVSKSKHMISQLKSRKSFSVHEENDEWNP